ncbi:hypothetical protein RCMRWORF_49 [Rhodobacter phage RcMrWorf]|nr:hypothetical protein RCMRWORF_49 [Rhodobacter phage RcMrWorf]
MTACAAPDPIIRTEYVKPDVPDALLRPVVVTCRDGDTSRVLGECALAYRAGLNRANSQIAAIAEVIQ